MADIKQPKAESVPAEVLRSYCVPAEVLRSYCAGGYGRMNALARVTGLHAGQLSRMSRGLSNIGMEHAIRLELASERAMKAEELCPSEAEIIAAFRSGS